MEQAIRLSHEKYCSATAMLSKTAEVTRDFEVVVEMAGQSSDVTFIPHQRGEDGVDRAFVHSPK